MFVKKQNENLEGDLDICIVSICFHLCTFLCYSSIWRSVSISVKKGTCDFKSDNCNFLIIATLYLSVTYLANYTISHNYDLISCNCDFFIIATITQMTLHSFKN